MTTPEQPEKTPDQEQVLAAFAAMAALALTSPRPYVFWSTTLDVVLLPMLGAVWAGAWGDDAGDPQPYLSQVRRYLADIDLEQPERAALTEFRAARHAGRDAGKVAKLPPGSTKTWTTQKDSQVRDTHRALHKVTVGVNESFIVGGFPAPTPGWWSLPPEERIACRCRITYRSPALTADGGPMPGPAAAGLAVVARDTGRVLMLQRCFCDTEDPARGKWEFPGGCLDDGETPLEAALREFGEETGLTLPEYVEHASYTSTNGVYQLFVQVIPAEADLDIHNREEGLNPDDPDDDRTEALAWWSLEDAAANPALRDEVKSTPWHLLMLPMEEAFAAALNRLEHVSSLEIMEELFDHAYDEGLITPVGIEPNGAIRYDLGGEDLTLEEVQAMLQELQDDDALWAAAGGADRNRGNAETLRRYWTTGPGGQRIGWGTPGDFNRCVAELTPHLGIRSKGYCQLRHKDATGAYAGHAPGEAFAATAALDAETLAALESIESEPSTGEDLIAAASAYPGEPIYDPEFFKPQDRGAAVPVEIDGNRVFGYVADWNVCHRSFKKCRTAPRSRTGYSQFHVGSVMTAAGPLNVGNLVLATEHASLAMTADAASRHYADSGSAVAVVRAGEDKYGIWVAGAIIDGTDPRDVATLRRCPLSGDWRNSEMVAALAVNVPGLPIPRERVANGRQVAMVAAGAIINPEQERLDDLALQLREEKIERAYADILMDRVLS